MKTKRRSPRTPVKGEQKVVSKNNKQDTPMKYYKSLKKRVGLLELAVKYLIRKIDSLPAGPK